MSDGHLGPAVARLSDGPGGSSPVADDAVARDQWAYSQLLLAYLHRSRSDYSAAASVLERLAEEFPLADDTPDLALDAALDRWAAGQGSIAGDSLRELVAATEHSGDPRHRAVHSTAVELLRSLANASPDAWPAPARPVDGPPIGGDPGRAALAAIARELGASLPLDELGAWALPLRDPDALCESVAAIGLRCVRALLDVEAIAEVHARQAVVVLSVNDAGRMRWPLVVAVDRSGLFLVRDPQRPGTEVLAPHRIEGWHEGRIAVLVATGGAGKVETLLRNAASLEDPDSAPGRPGAVDAHGWARLLAEREEEGAAAAAELVELMRAEHGQKVWVERLAAESAERSGDLERALDAWRRAVAVDDADEAAAFGLARLLARTGRSGDAIDAARRAMIVSASPVDALVLSGELLADVDPDLARRHLELAVDIDPSRSDGAFVLARLRGRSEGAGALEEGLRSLVARHPNHVESRLELARLAFGVGDWHRAERELEHVDDNDATALGMGWVRAEVASATGSADAVDACLAELERDPGTGVASVAAAGAWTIAAVLPERLVPAAFERLRHVLADRPGLAAAGADAIMQARPELAERLRSDAVAAASGESVPDVEREAVAWSIAHGGRADHVAVLVRLLEPVVLAGSAHAVSVALFVDALADRDPVAASSLAHRYREQAEPLLATVLVDRVGGAELDHVVVGDDAAPSPGMLADLAHVGLAAVGLAMAERSAIACGKPAAMGNVARAALLAGCHPRSLAVVQQLRRRVEVAPEIGFFAAASGSAWALAERFGSLQVDSLALDPAGWGNRWVWTGFVAGAAAACGRSTARHRLLTVAGDYVPALAALVAVEAASGSPLAPVDRARLAQVAPGIGTLPVRRLCAAIAAGPLRGGRIATLLDRASAGPAPR